MLSASSSHGTSGLSERRRKPRLSADSIIYVQLGSENGGIVVNLGTDGMAVHAAMELTAEKNSQFQLRLRGSGLNTELLGELVWLGATRKEVGISFRSPSAQVQKDIADWIERQNNAGGIVIASAPKKYEPASAVSPVAANEKKLIAALPAAASVAPTVAPVLPTVVSETVLLVDGNSKPLAIVAPPAANEEKLMTAAPSAASVTRAVVSDPLPLVDANFKPVAVVSPPAANEEKLMTAAPSAASVAPAVDSEPTRASEVPLGAGLTASPDVAVGLVPQPPPDIRAPIQDTDAVSNTVAWHLEMGDEDSLPFPESDQTESTFPSHRLFAPAIARSPHATPKLKSSEAEASSSPQEGNFTDADLMRSAFEDRFETSLNNLLERAGPQKWIPPVLLAAWMRGQRKHKLLLAAAAAASLIAFAFVLTLAVGRLNTILARSSPSAVPQQREITELPDASRPDVPTPQIEQTSAPALAHGPAPTEKHLAARPRPQQASSPSLASFAARLLGYDSDRADARMQLNEDQVEVRVWTSKSSGYYYCPDDLDYKSVKKPTQRTQLEALQSGYQPRLGQFCN